MTAHTTPLPVPCAVDWRELPRLMPPHGTGRPPAQPRYEQRLCASLALPGRERMTPSAARRHVVDTCRLWHVPRAAADDLQLITSELVTNAVVHGAGHTVTVTVLLSPAHLWVVVAEQRRPAGLPRPRRPIEPRTTGADAEDGRGLHLVEALATRYEVCPSADGTRAWACLTLPARRPLVEAHPADRTASPHPEDTDDVPRSHT